MFQCGTWMNMATWWLMEVTSYILDWIVGILNPCKLVYKSFK